MKAPTFLKPTGPVAATVLGNLRDPSKINPPLLAHSNDWSKWRRYIPRKSNTVIAEVLIRLLRGETLNSADAMTRLHTGRLSSVIGTLERDYGWPICRQRRAHAMPDGRVSWISYYSMPPEFCARIKGPQSIAYIDHVTSAREARAVFPSSAFEANQRAFNKELRRNYV